MDPQIIAAIVGIIGSLILWGLERFFKRKKRKSSIEYSIEHDKRIVKKIKDILEEFDADRAKVFRFHNGGAFLPDLKSMKKFSCIYEIDGKNVAPSQLELQNLHISMLHNPLSQLIETNEYLQPFVENMEDISEKYFFSDIGIKSMYAFLIRNINNDAIGFLSIDYVNKTVELTEDQLDQLRMYGSILGGYLE